MQGIYCFHLIWIHKSYDILYLMCINILEDRMASRFWHVDTIKIMQIMLVLHISMFFNISPNKIMTYFNQKIQFNSDHPLVISIKNFMLLFSSTFLPSNFFFLMISHKYQEEKINICFECIYFCMWFSHSMAFKLLNCLMSMKHSTKKK